MSDKKHAKLPRPGGIPFVIGVTGHRDLAREKDLEKIVEGVIAAIRRICPNTGIEILSPLAESADQLVARVGLENGCTIQVPLPYGEDEYLKKSFSEEGRKGYREILEHEEVGIPFVVQEDFKTLPPMNTQNVTEEDAGYARVGLYIAQNSHLLLALCEELPGPENSLNISGSLQVLHYRIRGEHGLVNLLDDSLTALETGWVIHIVSHRRKTSSCDHGNIQVKLLRPGTTSDQDYALEGGYNPINEKDGFKSIYDLVERIPAIKSLEEFNKELAVDPLTDEELESSKKGLFATDCLLPIDGQTNRAADWYPVIDAMANRYQRFHVRELKAVYSIAFCAIALTNLYSNLFKYRSLLVALMGCLVSLAAIYFRLRKLDHHRKYLDYRVLAEGLRIQAFWNYAELHVQTAANYLVHHAEEMEWVRHALCWAGRETRSPKAPPDAMNRMKILRMHWLGAQMRYHNKKIAAKEGAARTLETFTVLAFGTALALTVLLCVIHRPNASGPAWRDPTSLAMTGIGLASAASAIIAAYNQKRGWAEQGRQHRGMARMFKWWRRQLRTSIQTESKDRAPDLLEEIGRSALRESGDWLLLQRARPLEFPK